MRERLEPLPWPPCKMVEMGRWLLARDRIGYRVVDRPSKTWRIVGWGYLVRHPIRAAHWLFNPDLSAGDLP